MLRHLGPRLRRLAARRSPGAMVGALGREARLLGSAWRTEIGLARAGRRGTPVICGPFVGEPGFELLYWIPMLRRLLRRAGVAPDQVITISRGGTEPWYADLARAYLDAYDVYEPEDFAARLASRHREAGDAKQNRILGLDRELLTAARERFGTDGFALVHPSLMWARLRYVWTGDQGVAAARRRLEFKRLAIPAQDLQLPEAYVAVNAYASDCLPGTEASNRYVAELIERIAERSPVVLLSAGRPYEGHAHLGTGAMDGVHTFGEGLDPRHNLELKSAALAGAGAFMGTYGGFCYLAPLLGVRGTAIYSDANFNPVHLEVARLACADTGAPDVSLLDIGRIEPAELASRVLSKTRRDVGGHPTSGYSGRTTSGVS